MRKILVLISMVISMNACAQGVNSVFGLYLGAQGDVGSFVPVDGAAFNSSLIPISLSVRPYVGFRFNDYLAVETGYISLVNDQNDGGKNNGIGVEGPDHYRLYLFDLTGKLIYPFANGFSLYAKAGAGYAHQSVYNQSYENLPPSADSEANKVLPLAGVGISYHFNPQFSADFSYTRVFGNGPIGNINLLGLGLTYGFNFY